MPFSYFFYFICFFFCVNVFRQGLALLLMTLIGMRKGLALLPMIFAGAVSGFSFNMPVEILVLKLS